MGLLIGIGHWNWGLGSGIEDRELGFEIGDWGLGLGIGIGDWELEFRIKFGIGD